MREKFEKLTDSQWEVMSDFLPVQRKIHSSGLARNTWNASAINFFSFFPVFLNGFRTSRENGPANGLQMVLTNVKLLSSGNLMLGGYLYRFLPTGPQNEAWLAKLSPSGMVIEESGSNCGVVSTQVIQLDSIRNVRCYPNPANNYINFDWYGENVSAIKIFNLWGETIQEKNLTPGINNLIFDVSEYKNGLYLYKITLNGSTYYTGSFLISKN